MSTRQTVLVVIASDIYVRNYVESGVLDALTDAYDLHFAVRSSVGARKRIGERPAHYAEYSYSPRHQRVGQLVFDVMMLRFAERSQSFAFRAKRVFPSLRHAIKSKLPPWEYVRQKVRAALLTPISSGPGFRLFKRAFVDRLQPNGELRAIVEASAPQLVIVPTSAYSIDAIDVVKICRELRVPTLLLVDNWDNLSSKSIFWERPDHVAVWGEQSKQHAVDIQGFRPDDVSLIGTPRFDSYFELRGKALPSHFDFPYALFVGTALPFDEARALRALDEELAANADVYGGLKLVYRPHPWRQGKDSIAGDNLKHVVLDPQMVENYSRRTLSQSFQPSLDYYPALLSNAAFALGGVSSMLIESVVFAKRYLVLVYDEPGNILSPRHVYENYVHFRGLERLQGLLFCQDFARLKGEFRRAFLASKEPQDLAAVDRERMYFLYSDDHSYQQRLRALVDRLISSVVAPGLRSQ